MCKNFFIIQYQFCRYSNKKWFTSVDIEYVLNASKMRSLKVLVPHPLSFLKSRCFVMAELNIDKYWQTCFHMICHLLTYIQYILQFGQIINVKVWGINLLLFECTKSMCVFLFYLCGGLQSNHAGHFSPLIYQGSNKPILYFDGWSFKNSRYCSKEPEACVPFQTKKQ